MSYRVRLDAESCSSSGTYDGGNDRTAYDYPVGVYGSSGLVAFRTDTNASLTIESTTSTEVRISGDTSALEVAIGFPVEMTLVLNPPQWREGQGQAEFAFNARVKETTVRYDNAGDLTISWTGDAGAKSETVSVTAGTIESGDEQVPTLGDGRTINVTVTSDDERPATISGYTQLLMKRSTR